MTPTLFDVEPTQGRTRASDPQTSASAGRTAQAAKQRRLIARLLLTRDYVTADDVWQADLTPNRPDRASYSTRLGGLVADGLMVAGDPVPRTHRGRERLVLSYWPTDEGRRWFRDLLAERSAP